MLALLGYSVSALLLLRPIPELRRAGAAVAGLTVSFMLVVWLTVRKMIRDSMALSTSFVADEGAGARPPSA